MRLERGSKVLDRRTVFFLEKECYSKTAKARGRPLVPCGWHGSNRLRRLWSPSPVEFGLKERLSLRHLALQSRPAPECRALLPPAGRLLIESQDPSVSAFRSASYLPSWSRRSFVIGDPIPRIEKAKHLKGSRRIFSTLFTLHSVNALVDQDS